MEHPTVVFTSIVSGMDSLFDISESPTGISDFSILLESGIKLTLSSHRGGVSQNKLLELYRYIDSLTSSKIKITIGDE